MAMLAGHWVDASMAAGEIRRVGPHFLQKAELIGQAALKTHEQQPNVSRRQLLWARAVLRCYPAHTIGDATADDPPPFLVLEFGIPAGCHGLSLDSRAPPSRVNLANMRTDGTSSPSDILSVVEIVGHPLTDAIDRRGGQGGAISEASHDQCSSLLHGAPL